MGTDISGIVKSILQVKASLKSELSDQGADQGITVSFMDLMNQNSLPNMNVSTGPDQIKFQADTKGTSNTAYDAYLTPVRSVSVQEATDVTPEEMQEIAAEPLEIYAEEICKILEEELGVTEEEISVAMESLGMSFLDLRNLQNLTSLVQALTGEDIGTLFASESFQSVMEQVTVVTDALCAELGITKEELNILCEAWEEMEQIQVPDSADIAEVTEILDIAEVTEILDIAEVTEILDIAEVTEVTEEPDLAAEKSVLVKDAEEALTVDAEEKIVPKDEAVTIQKEYVQSEEKVERSVEKAVEKVSEKDSQSVETSQQVTVETQKDADSDKQNFLDHSKDSKPDLTGEGAVFTAPEHQTVRTEEFILPQETPGQPYANQVDAFDLIDQIARNVRVTITGTATSMEMQLNPEHLGKIYLNVTEREGVVRAQIAAQNTVVKEALETQLVELRQSLNQQGIKVDAIEVTVSTHEFEQNLEENARHEEQMQQQMEDSQKQTRRNLNLNDLDGLTGLMSEEEQLAAQIMRDNGNQVDLTA